MAHKGGKGTTRNGRDSRSKRLGIKLFAGQPTQAGSVLVRQRGTRYLPGENVRRGKDDTLYAVTNGKVAFRTIRKKAFSGIQRVAKIVNVIPQSN